MSLLPLSSSVDISLLEVSVRSDSDPPLSFVFDLTTKGDIFVDGIPDVVDTAATAGGGITDDEP